MGWLLPGLFCLELFVVEAQLLGKFCTEKIICKNETRRRINPIDSNQYGQNFQRQCLITDKAEENIGAYSAKASVAKKNVL